MFQLDSVLVIGDAMAEGSNESDDFTNQSSYVPASVGS